MMKTKIVLKHTIFFLFIAAAILAQPKIPELKYFATDFTGTLNQGQITQISRNLKAFQDSTSNQLLFLMITSLNGYPLENYTYEVAKKNKIGTKQHDNGILFFVAKMDRKLRIEVGYGLEGVLPDALASSILRNEIRPYFRNGDYFGGISRGILAIEDAVRGEYKGNKNSDGSEGTKFPIAIIWFIIFVISMFARGKRGRGRGGIYFIGGGGSSSSFGGSGGFGGFSGGGGSFGGGGASGGW